jgi:hypothetical protein
MDLSAMIAGLGPLRPCDVENKLQALQYAYSRVVEEADETPGTHSHTFETFIQRLPPSLTARHLGGPADDFYFTSILACIAQEQSLIDPVMVAVINRIVLQLNYQTRFIGERGLSEALVLDGATDLLPAVMVNGNVVFGFAVAPIPQMAPLPGWAAGRYRHISVLGNMLFHRTLPDIAPTIRSLQRDRIGCLALSLDYGDDSLLGPLTDRYATLVDMLRSDSFIVLHGEPALIVDALAQAESAAPEAKITGKLYAGPQGEPKAVGILHGFSRMPAITLRRGGPIRPRFTSAYGSEGAPAPGIRRLAYFAGENGSGHEIVTLAPPLAIIAAAPMSEEARRHLTARHVVPHRATAISGGGIFSSIDPFHVTYIHTNAEGDIIDDIAEASNLSNTPVFRDGCEGDDGKRVGLMRPLNRVKVRGAAMPLTFTPTLHEFFSHFLIQCFPRLLILEDLGLEATILVPPTLRLKQRQMLNLAGIPDERIVTIPPNTHVVADELIVPEPWPLCFSLYTLQIYDRLIHRLGGRRPLTNKRVLISREDRTHWRNMLTYDAVRETLVNDYSFEVVRPEKLNLEEELRLFSDNRIIAGAEGAGLYGACYSRPGQVFISISDEDYVMPILGSATTCRGSQVAYAFGESFRADSDVDRRKPFGHSDFAIAPSSVAKLIDIVLQKL